MFSLVHRERAGAESAAGIHLGLDDAHGRVEHRDRIRRHDDAGDRRMRWPRWRSTARQYKVHSRLLHAHGALLQRSALLLSAALVIYLRSEHNISVFREGHGRLHHTVQVPGNSFVATG